MTRHEETSAGERSRKREIRLQPPARRPVPRLEPPPRPPLKTPEKTPGGRLLRWGTGLFLMLLILAAVAVFALLPGWVEERRAGVASAAAEASPHPPAEAVPAPRPPAEAPDVSSRPAASGDARQRAESALERLIPLRRRLEERAVERWGGEDLAAARGRAEAGDSALTRQQFDAAATAYEAAFTLFERLEKRWPQALEDALDQGRRALAGGDATAAGRAFERAQAIDAGNAEAARGLARAAVFDDVARHLATASAHENAGDRAAAARSYRAALELDPATQEARQALGRIEAQRAAESFRQAMSDGLAALDSEDFSTAKRAFERALELRPGAAESADGLARAEAGLRRRQIETLRLRALDHERDEAWRQAAEAYHQVLRIDPTVLFAQTGLRRAQQRAELYDALDARLARPDRLAAAEVLVEASDLLERARAVDGGGPELRLRTAKLEALIGDYASTVTARLLSDERTDVTVYKVGHLGAFSSYALELRPGTYTVVGSRQGFRDVRRQLVIRPGEAPEPLMIRCEEPI